MPPAKAVKPASIDRFDLQPGRVIAGKYVVDGLLGRGWEGEVYKVIEERTGVPRAAKFFYPQRNPADKAVKFSASKLERFRRCPITVQYHHSETIRMRGLNVTCLISEYAPGEALRDFVAQQSDRRLEPFVALCILHALTAGLEPIHAAMDYHGDLHSGNVLVARRGIHFDVKLLDFFPRGRASTANIHGDVVELARLLYDAVGGREHYADQPPEIKQICCGLKHGLITAKFGTAGKLRQHLDSFEWSG